MLHLNQYALLRFTLQGSDNSRTTSSVDDTMPYYPEVWYGRLCLLSMFVRRGDDARHGAKGNMPDLTNLIYCVANGNIVEYTRGWSYLIDWMPSSLHPLLDAKGNAIISQHKSKVGTGKLLSTIMTQLDMSVHPVSYYSCTFGSTNSICFARTSTCSRVSHPRTC